MIRSCDDCQEWAQWLVRKPVYGPDVNDKSKLVIVKWENVAYLCGAHKQMMAEIPNDLRLHFNFVGSIPAMTQ